MGGYRLIKMEGEYYDPKEYNLKDFIKDSRFLSAAHFNLDYSPDVSSWDEEKISIMRNLIKNVYTHLYGQDGERIPVDECSEARIFWAFRNIYCQKVINMDMFRKSVLESLGHDWKNYLLAREIARIERKIGMVNRDKDLEYLCDERIGIILDRMSPEEMKKALKDIHKRENTYRLMHAKP